MGVINGQAVNAAVTNAAFIDSTEDDTATGVLTLASVEAVSGSQVDNIQREHNSIASFVGKALNAVKDILPSWAASQFSSTHNLFQRVDAISVQLGYIEQAITDGQAATDVTGELFDGTFVSSVSYEVEIIRGTTVFSNGRIVMQYINGTWRVVRGMFLSDIVDDGVTFSVNQVGSGGQLQVALDSGAGSGTIKLRKVTFDV